MKGIDIALKGDLYYITQYSQYQCTKVDIALKDIDTMLNIHAVYQQLLFNTDTLSHVIYQYHYSEININLLYQD